MIVCIDIGNTNIVLACFENQKIVKTYRIATKGFSAQKLSFLENEKFEKVFIASVVPSINSKIVDFFKKRTPIVKLFSVEDALSLMPSDYKEHSNLGIDRIINSISAYDKYKEGLIVVDLGTATTFDVVSKKGVYEGGAITFGIKTAMETLFYNTEKLKLIDCKNLGEISAIGKTTKECLKSGIVLGYAGLVDGLIQKIKKQKKEAKIVVACGGLATTIKPFTIAIDYVEENLTLYGLKLLGEKLNEA